MSNTNLYLKRADREDVDVVVNLIEELFDFSVYSTVSTFDRSYVKDLFYKSLQTPNKIATILLKNEEQIIGLLVAGKTENPVNKKEELASELAFWIKPEYRTKQAIKILLSVYKQWAKLHNCVAYYLGKIDRKHSIEKYFIRKVN